LKNNKPSDAININREQVPVNTTDFNYNQINSAGNNGNNIYNSNNYNINNNNNNNNNSSNHITKHKKRKRKSNHYLNKVIGVIASIFIIIASIGIYKNTNSQNKTSSNESGNTSTINSSVTNSSLTGFWGDNINITKEILPLQEAKTLKVWPSIAGFDIIKNDISGYKSKQIDQSPLKGIIVIIDPGHGGDDLGAVYPRAPKKTEIAESKVNLAIAFKLKEKLEQIGAKVILTRTDNTFLKLYYRSAVVAKTTLNEFYNKLSLDSSNKNIIKEYLLRIEQTLEANSDEDKTGWFYGLGVRREIKNIMDLQSAETNCLFISLHCNSSETPDSLHGTKVYYSTNKAIYDDEVTIPKDVIFPEYQFYDDENRERLAALLYGNIIEDNPALTPKDTENAVFARNYAVIREQNIVSALIELGYVNHLTDRKILLDSDKQNELAASITEAIFEYYCEK